MTDRNRAERRAGNVECLHLFDGGEFECGIVEFDAEPFPVGHGLQFRNCTDAVEDHRAVGPQRTEVDHRLVAVEPERRLNYVFANGIMLQLFNLLGLFVLSGYAVVMFVSLLHGRTGFLLTISRHDVFRIAVWGVFIPLLLFFALMEFSPLGGRSLGLNRHNPEAFLRLAIEAFLFLFLLPAPFLILWHRACRKRGRELGFRKLPSAVVHCNMFLGWVVLLVSFTALIRPGLCLAERHWTNREQLLIHTEFSSGLEDQAVRDTRMELLKILPK